MHQWFMALENLTDKELIFMARLEFLKGFILIEKLRGLWNFSFFWSVWQGWTWIFKSYDKGGD